MLKTEDIAYLAGYCETSSTIIEKGTITFHCQRSLTLRNRLQQICTAMHGTTEGIEVGEDYIRLNKEASEWIICAVKELLVVSRKWEQFLCKARQTG